MEKILIALMVCMMAVGCKSGTDKKASEDVVVPNTDTTSMKPKRFKDTTVAGCYIQVLKRDTFVANLQQQEGLVHGRLNFDNFEKDGSTGTVSGILEGDILKLDYAFASEGMTSVMELYFKYKDGTLFRGIGEMNTKGDTAYFVNPAMIKYDGEGLQKVDCQNLPDKYR